jgi:formate hydrogenlyase subunit 3/multisubunit Na+/H+ antiporter MnhD subunit
MNSKNSKWLMFIATLACIGCCAIPLYGVFAGIFSIGTAALLLANRYSELLLCLLPLGVIVSGYYMYKRQQTKKSCCDSPREECNEAQCIKK